MGDETRSLCPSPALRIPNRKESFPIIHRGEIHLVANCFDVPPLPRGRADVEDRAGDEPLPRGRKMPMP